MKRSRHTAKMRLVPSMHTLPTRTVARHGPQKCLPTARPLKHASAHAQLICTGSPVVTTMTIWWGTRSVGAALHLDVAPGADGGTAARHIGALAGLRVGLAAVGEGGLRGGGVLL